MGIYSDAQKFAPLLGKEKRHGKPKDSLTLDVLDAERAGMSYGQYKALHPNTKDANEARLEGKPKRPAPVRRVYELYCSGCGEKFTTTNAQRRYCGDSCKEKSDGAIRRARAKRKKEV
jgi:hypothetical protein